MNAPLPQRPVSSPAAWTPEIAAAVAALAADPQHPTGLPAPTRHYHVWLARALTARALTVR